VWDRSAAGTWRLHMMAPAPTGMTLTQMQPKYKYVKITTNKECIKMLASLKSIVKSKIIIRK